MQFTILDKTDERIILSLTIYTAKEGRNKVCIVVITSSWRIGRAHTIISVLFFLTSKIQFILSHRLIKGGFHSSWEAHAHSVSLWACAVLLPILLSIEIKLCQQGGKVDVNLSLYIDKLS